MGILSCFHSHVYRNIHNTTYNRNAEFLGNTMQVLHPYYFSRIGSGPFFLYTFIKGIDNIVNNVNFPNYSFIRIWPYLKFIQITQFIGKTRQPENYSYFTLIDLKIHSHIFKCINKKRLLLTNKIVTPLEKNPRITREKSFHPQNCSLLWFLGRRNFYSIFLQDANKRCYYHCRFL